MNNRFAVFASAALVSTFVDGRVDRLEEDVIFNLSFSFSSRAFRFLLFRAIRLANSASSGTRLR